MYVVYVIQNTETYELYISFTKKLNQRIESHNARANRATTRLAGTWTLLYAETYRSEHDARVRESKLKHHGSAKHGLMRRIEHCILKGKK